MPDKDPEEKTQEEIRKEAPAEPDDAQTHREEIELELMEEGKSDEGEEIGEHID